MRIFLHLILASLVALAPTAGARTHQTTPGAGKRERRVALVIGNGAYKVGELKGAVNNARDMTRVLRELHFEVAHKEDLTQNEMKRAIGEFGDRLRRGGGVGLFYYAGHGLQVGGDNYLIPVDAAPNIEEEVEYESVNAGRVLAQMEGARNGLNILILDACRNNPFERTFRSTSRGLARMSAHEGTLIAYATSPGSVASVQGEEGGGVYTQELLRFIRVPGLSVEQVFKKVRTAVRDRTHGKQTPWEVSSLTGNFYFAGAETKEGGDAEAARRPRPGAGGGGVSGDHQPSSGVEVDSGRDPRVQARAAALYKKLRSLKKRDYSEAVASYRKSLRSEPNNAALHNALAGTLQMKAEWEWYEMAKSLEATRKGVERKRFWLAVLSMAVAGAIGGPNSPPPNVPEWGVEKGPLPPFTLDDEIVSEFKAAARLDPRNAKYHNDFGAALFESRNNPTVIGTKAEEQAKAGAEAAFRRAIELEPHNPAFLRNFGNALNSRDKWAEAEAVFRRSVGLEPNDVSHHVGLFIAVIGQNKLTDAARVYLEVKRLKTNSALRATLASAIKDKKAFDQEVKRLKKISTK